MEKVLTLCIPSYNMHSYLHRCIDSLISASCILNALDVIIVNDGSTDDTLAIANDYAMQHPQSIRVIDKSNGHYGSCVNAALRIACGRYFRILDADDWFDTDALQNFVESLQGINVDAVCTNYVTRNFDTGNNITNRVDGVEYMKVYDMNNFCIPIRALQMHHLTYRTDFLREIGYTQTEGICYTDTEYVYFPLSAAKDIVFLDLDLYQYFVGRGDQSMSLQSLRKNAPHYIKVAHRIAFDEANLQSNKNKLLIRQRLLARFNQMCLWQLRYVPSFTDEEAARQVLRKIEETDSDLFKELMYSIVEVHTQFVKCWYDNTFFSRMRLRIAQAILRWRTGDSICSFQ